MPPLSVSLVRSFIRIRDAYSRISRSCNGCALRRRQSGRNKRVGTRVQRSRTHGIRLTSDSLPPLTREDVTMHGHQTAARRSPNHHSRSAQIDRPHRAAARARIAGSALIAALAMSGANASAAPAPADGALANYAAIEQALLDGHSVVNVRLDMSHCTSTEGNKPGPAIRGGVSIGSFLIPEGRFIAFID